MSSLHKLIYDFHVYSETAIPYKFIGLILHQCKINGFSFLVRDPKDFYFMYVLVGVSLSSSGHGRTVILMYFQDFFFSFFVQGFWALIVFSSIFNLN